MKSRSVFTKEENGAWLDYDKSFSDLMDDGEVRENHYEDLKLDPVPKNEWGKYGEYELVGNGKQTNSLCGHYSGVEGCLNVDLHNHSDLNGFNHKGKVHVEKRFFSCDKPECPVCFKKGWAVREAFAIKFCIEQASNGFVDKNGKKHMGLGEPHHIIASVPQVDYGLKFKKLRVKIVKVVRSRGVIGGVFIFHAFRYRDALEAEKDNQPQGWYWSPHFHIIGFVDGAYSCCRKCENSWLDWEGDVHVLDTEKCLVCKAGFEGRTRRAFLKEGGLVGVSNGKGYIVKIKGKRKTIFGTAWYQLNHASMVRGNSEKGTHQVAHVATWFGVCSYTKLKLKKEDRIQPHKCPHCQHDLVEVKFVGLGEPFEWWEKSKDDDFLDPDGAVRWIEKPHVDRWHGKTRG